MNHTIIPYENLKTLNKPFEDELKQKFSDFLDKGWYILGEEVSLFEKEFGDFHKEKYVVGVANGLDALILSLKCCNFKTGDEVIVPSNTYIATILAILHCGLTPVFVEPDIATYNINPEEIKKALTKRTVAIMLVHLYGQCCDMDAITSIAKENNLKLIEDCAQAHGATFKGQIAGTFGDFSAFSFYPTKNLGALGDAGAIICKSEDDYNTLRQLRNYGSEKKYHNGIVGYNSRLDEIQAAFLRIKLPHLREINAHKKKLASIYHLGLSNDFIKPVINSDFINVYHIFNIRHQERDRLKDYLLANHIGTEIHYPISPHRQKALKAMNHLNYPISSEIHKTTLSLPCSFAHQTDDIHRVVDVLNKFK
ncbi:DegT/DnrJ/EryC1/StrS family aminotransferase [Pedobacter hiemivivus]|uniref:DegT/DnrJ/EryC1/StrS family aminotransferase n=1 Tax=Pedobacter hiemivivus TaxID=2530454 RepID=A0A4U1G909_9SPHI|nr:DegT/DnrJ/EryC1/StrS family aminotransferase [Pedobacter hiemivivus]TKC59250.1 DegT/DnrJ/EryC1/StrS family aminotransferase [Pedobacter hiemivivus]